MKSAMLLVIASVLLLSCRQIKSKPITEFSQKDIKNAHLVDVRTPEEFAKGHLENALNINWFDPDFARSFDTISKQKTLYLYCKKGGRSTKAAKLLDSMGYTTVNLLGGYEALQHN